MVRDVFRYRFAPTVPLEEVELSLLVAIVAAESLHGEPAVRLDLAYVVDTTSHACVIDGAGPAARDLNRLFIGFLSREFGEDAFTVQRVEQTR